MSQSSPIKSGKPHAAQDPNATLIEEKSPEQFNAEIALTFIKKGEKTITETDRLVSQAMDARAALDFMSDVWKKDWLEFMDQSDERLKSLRMIRMAFDSETKILMGNLREVRQFFMDKQHELEITRLKEFVDLCERLKRLKESGFLDVVADTMLKLS